MEPPGSRRPFSSQALTSISMITQEKRKQKEAMLTSFAEHVDVYIHIQACTHRHTEQRTHTHTHTHTHLHRSKQSKLSIAYITLDICNLSCSLRKIIEATSQYANRMIISLHYSATICTEKNKKRNSYIVSNFNRGHLLTHFLLESNLSLQNKTNRWQDEWITMGETGCTVPRGTKSPDY